MIIGKEDLPKKVKSDVNKATTQLIESKTEEIVSIIAKEDEQGHIEEEKGENSISIKDLIS